MRALSLRRATAVVAAAALTLVLTPAVASAETPGGSTPETAVALPIADFDSSFTASNAAESTVRGWIAPGLPVWNNVTWYTVTPSTTTNVFIRATSPGWDNTLEVWTAAGALVAQNDDFYGLDSSLTVTLTAGTTYRIGLGGYGEGSRGSATLTFASRVPGAPAAPAVTTDEGSATVSWAPPADVAGGVTGYQVLCTPDGGAEYECATLSGTPPETSTTVGGLTNGVAYTFRVAARNVLGYGDPSPASDPATPRANASVTLSTTPAAPVSGESFAVTATVTSSATVTGTVDLTVEGVTTAGVALVGGQATVSGLVHAAGPVAVSAAYSGATAVRPATTTGTVTVAKRSQTVTVSALPTGLVYDDEPVTVSASSSEGLAVTLSASGACTLTGDQLTFTGVGTCRVEGTQAGTTEVSAASAAVEAAVGQRPQTLTVGDLPAMVYGDQVTLSASSSVGLPAELSATGACSIDAGDVVATGIGECTVTVDQPGDAVTAAASAVVRTQSVGKRPQTVTLTELPDLLFAMTPIPLLATSQFDLPVTLSAAGACAMVDGELEVIGVGTCTVTATAEGDDVTLPGSATLTREVTGPPTEVEVELEAELGDQAEETVVSAVGTGLLPGSELVLEVHSTPQRIGSAVVAEDGTATVSGVLPALEPGDHELVAIGTSLEGEPTAMVTTFTVASSGRIVAIAGESLPAEVVRAARLAATGTDPAAPAVLALLWVLTGAALLVLRRRLAPTA